MPNCRCHVHFQALVKVLHPWPRGLRGFSDVSECLDSVAASSPCSLRGVVMAGAPLKEGASMAGAPAHGRRKEEVTVNCGMSLGGFVVG
jgi:hypothetical protein